MEKAHKKITSFLGSKLFFWLVVGLFIFQALWIAFSFRYPMMYDEGFHFSIIKIYSHQLSPIIVDQPVRYDALRDLTHEGSKLFHYLMSFPLRLSGIFTNNEAAQVIFLRVLNVLMAAAGLVIFRKIFRNLGIRLIYTNIAILLFILIPIVPFVAATINYDNLLLPLTAFYLLICVRILRNYKQARWYEYANLVTLGCAASLVKYTFLPVFAASVLYLAIFLWKKTRKTFFAAIKASFIRTAKLQVAIVISGLIIAVSLFSIVYVQNVVRYGTPNPSCTQTMPKERCLSSAIERRNTQARTTRDQRKAVAPPRYVEAWLNTMATVSTVTATTTTKGNVAVRGELPVIYNFLFFGAFLAGAVLLYAWRSLRKNAGWYFGATMTAVLFLSVFYVNFKGYYTVHIAYANQPRYLLSLLPFALVMVVIAASFVLRNHVRTKLLSLAVALVLLVQGGGAVTHILLSQDNWYWQDNRVIRANHAAKKVLAPLIK
jgi:hypothetical protein